jgi:hypothetical protein
MDGTVQQETGNTCLTWRVCVVLLGFDRLAIAREAKPIDHLGIIPTSANSIKAVSTITVQIER